MGTKPPRKMFVVASILTGVCAVLMLGLIVAILTAPSGMEGLWVLFLGIAVAGVHVVLGLPALLLALATRRHFSSWWIFAYFGLSVVAAAFVLQAMGVFDGPAQAVQRRWHEFTHPADARLCRGLSSFAPVVELARALEEGADASAVCDSRERWASMTPLQIASYQNRADVAELLISAGAPAARFAEGVRPPLVLALSGRYGISDEHAREKRRQQIAPIRDTVNVLLAAGAEADAPDSGGISTLHWAANLNDVGLVESFLDAGADVEAVDDWDRTPSSVAVRWGGLEVLEVLLRRGANPLPILEQVVVFGTPEMLAAVFDLTDVNPSAATEYDLLFVAAQRGKGDVLEALVAEGIDPDATSESGRPLVWSLAEPRYAEALKLLLDAGVDPDRKWKGSEMPLHFAARLGATETISALLDAGAEIDARSGGQTPLMLAARKGRTEAVRVLLARGADPALLDGGGDSALDIAEAEGHLEICRILR